jgi:hypothetical protein
MKKHLAITLILATATIGMSMLSVSQASAGEVRDHRQCQKFDPNCRDHRGPVIVVPPPPVSQPPIVVIDPIRPRPPIEPPHHTSPWDDQDEYRISCGEGRRIVRQSGFRRVRAIDCSGNTYRYNASSRDGRVTVLVNMDGDIVRVNLWN